MPDEIYASNYEIQEDIAQGAMGMVRKALDLKLNRIVALKIIHPHLSSDDTFRKRFLREARAMAQLQHPNIVIIHAVGQHEGTQFIEMEYFPGGNLSTRMAPDTCLPMKDAMAIALQLASALAYAHDRAIIHRDIKPANVLINSDNLIKLTDFGIAAALDESPLTNAGQLIGTLRYMSPEQARDATLDGRSDLYSLGLMFYEMVTGSHPRRNQSNTAILSMLAAEGNAPPLSFPDDVPVEVRQIIQDLVRFRPADRIKDARTLVQRLESIHMGATPRISELDGSNHPSADATIFELGSQKPIPPAPKRQTPQRQIDLKRLSVTLLLGGIVLGSGVGLYKVVPILRENLLRPPAPSPAKSFPLPDNTPSPILTKPTEPTAPTAVELPKNLSAASVEKTLTNGATKNKPDQPNSPIGNTVPPSATTKPAADPPRPVRPAASNPSLPSMANTLEASAIEPKPLAPPPALPMKGPETAAAPIPEQPPAQTPLPVVATASLPTIDQNIRSRLEQFRKLVGKKDLAALKANSSMSNTQRENFELLFESYATIETSLGPITVTATGLATTLRIDKLITTDGDSVPVEDMLRTMPIMVPRNGDQWGPITW